MSGVVSSNIAIKTKAVAPILARMPLEASAGFPEEKLAFLLAAFGVERSMSAPHSR
jgi:hypothetical protein